MDDLAIQKVRQFVQDRAMFDAVTSVMLKSFLKTREGDVQMKAAQRLAIDFHFESCEDLRRIHNNFSREIKEKVQTAL